MLSTFWTIWADESLSEVVDENRRNADISLDLTSLNTQPISQRISNLQKEMDKDKQK